MNGFSELYIYKDCEILKNKNFKVDHIQDYLGTLFNFHALNKTNAQNKLIPINAQFFKHGLKTSVVVELKQTRLDDLDPNKRAQELTNFHDNYNFNYMAVRNCDERAQGNYFRFEYVYYFIVGRKWASENSILFELEMDVINTLIDNTEDGTEPLILSPKTTIMRQHKDRWKKGTEPNKMYAPLVDFYSEGLNVPLFKKKEHTLYELFIDSEVNDKLLNESFYLIYRSKDNPDDNPNSEIDVLMCLDDPVTVSGGTLGYNGHKDPVTDLGYSNQWYILGSDGDGTHTNQGCTISFRSRNGVESITLSADQFLCITIGNIYLYSTNSSGSTHIATYRPPFLRRFRDVEFAQVFSVRKSNYTEELTRLTPSIITGMSVDTSFPTDSQPQRIGCITDIKRTDPKLLKILKLPYKPLNLSFINDDEIILPAGWGVRQADAELTTMMKYTGINATECFKSEFEVGSLVDDYPERVSPFTILGQRNINNFGDIVNKNLDFETKLLHSDFFVQKFVYDSFAYDFKSEYIKNQTDPSPLRIQFLCTATMSSKMAFRFVDLQFLDGGDDNGDKGIFPDLENYSNLLYVARNNELPIYNSAYINYIRTGFNYDVKTKNRQLRSNIVSSSIQLSSALLSALSSSVTGAVGIAGAVALGSSAINSIYKTIEQNAQADQNIEQKLKSAEMQGLSVLGSDDVDIMSEYTIDNKAKLVTFEVSERMKNCLFDLFYYTGYIANFQGIPDTTSRMWFNFVMASPVYYYEQSFPQELLDELSKKYREGITFLHKVVIYEDEEPIERWDFDQQYENWENNVLPIPRIRELYSVSSMQAGREYVIKSDLSSITSLGYLLNAGKLTWRMRRKSDLKVISEITDLDQYRITGSSIYVIRGNTIYKTCTYSTYANADYYWTIEFSENTSSGEHQENAYSSIMGYIEFI